MQRYCEIPVLVKLLNKYQERYDECEIQRKSHITELQSVTNEERKNWLCDDIISINIQSSIYECIIKDLRGIIG